MFDPLSYDRWIEYQEDWLLFAREYLHVDLDPEQESALKAIQTEPKVAIASGTSRGKDYLMAVAAICFMYLTPEFENGNMVSNTKCILSGPTQRQVEEIIMPEIARVHRNSEMLPGELTTQRIRTRFEEWFLIAFKADGQRMEAWSGFHAVNIFFGITEATGMPEMVFQAVEGNLQGNSRLVLVFNPNISTGYAAQAMRSSQFKKFRLNSLNAPNVKEKRIVFQGQVNYEWVREKTDIWCTPITESEILVEENDFEFEGNWYRPSDLYRTKVLGIFPKSDSGALIPVEWIELANQRYEEFKRVEKISIWKKKPLRLGVDIAGMGRDSSCFCFRYGQIVEPFRMMHSGGNAEHMKVTGEMINILRMNVNAFEGLWPQAFLDSIGEGAGVYSRALEMSEIDGNDWIRVHSVKFSAKSLNKDATGQYEFDNLRAYLYWAVRDWLNPIHNKEACLCPDEELKEELTSMQWEFKSNSKIIIEPKDDIKKRLKRSPDKSDALANTFYPVQDVDPNPKKLSEIAKIFH